MSFLFEQTLGCLWCPLAFTVRLPRPPSKLVSLFFIFKDRYTAAAAVLHLENGGDVAESSCGFFFPQSHFTVGKSWPSNREYKGKSKVVGRHHRQQIPPPFFPSLFKRQMGGNSISFFSYWMATHFSPPFPRCWRALLFSSPRSHATCSARNEGERWLRFLAIMAYRLLHLGV